MAGKRQLDPGADRFFHNNQDRRFHGSILVRDRKKRFSDGFCGGKEARPETGGRYHGFSYRLHRVTEETFPNCRKIIRVPRQIR